MLLARMQSGFAVFSDNQFLPGYCILLAYPKVASLNELSLAERSRYLLDTTLIGDAIMKVCKPLRLNYSTLMNFDSYLHTHIEARYSWEPKKYREMPTWLYPRDQRYIPEYYGLNEKFDALKAELSVALRGMME
jgi:diadenosine tetraphosphate (Ap4A) HIT family hydrolase